MAMVMHPAPARQGSLEMSTNTLVSGHPQMHKVSEVRERTRSIKGELRC